MAEVCPAGALLSAPPQCLPLSLPAMCLSVSSGCVLGQGVPGAGTAPPIPPGHCLSCLCLDLWELSNSPAWTGWVGRAASQECSSLEKRHPNLFNVAT